jgi:hypothetical protein
MALNPNRGGRGELPNNGKPVFASKSSGRTWTIHFRPAASAIELAQRLDEDFQPPTGPILLAKGDADEGSVEVYPHNTTAVSRGLFGPKYDVLRTIRFENLNMVHATSMEDADWVLGRLIEGFVRTPQAGLGIDHELISIVDELEAAGVSQLVVRAGPRKGLPRLDTSGCLTIAGVQFGELRRAVRGIHSKALDKARDEKHRAIRNTVLTAVDPIRFPAQPPPYEKGAIIAAIRAGTESGLTKKDQDATLAAMAPVAREVVRRKPEAVQAVAREIELVSLEELIGRYEKLLAANGSEETWQKFFRAYPFVLKLAFGYPIVAMGEQVSVGGGRFDGKGEKIADFTATAALSGNLALVEIKKPGSRLLGQTPYREGVYAPSRELSGSVAQVLDQKYQMQTDFAGKKVKSRAWDVEAYAIQCLVVIGSNPATDDEKKSFELFRRDLRQVLVITFDELLSKLRTILGFLKADLPAASDENGATTPEAPATIAEAGEADPPVADGPDGDDDE